MNGLGRGQKDNNNSNNIFTFETWGMVIVLFSFLSFVCLITKDLIFGQIGLKITYFLLGVFGYAAYAFVICLFYVGFVMVSGKKLTASPKKVSQSVFLVLLLALLIHSITSSSFSTASINDYIKACFDAGAGETLSATGGGVVLAIIVYPIVKLITFWGAYVVFSLAIVGVFYALAQGRGQNIKKSVPAEKNVLGYKKYPESAFDFSESNEEGVKESKRLLCHDDDFELKTKKELKSTDKKRNDSLKILYPNGSSGYYKAVPQAERKNENIKSYQEKYVDSIDENISYPSKPIKIVTDTTKYAQQNSSFIDMKKPPEKYDFFKSSFQNDKDEKQPSEPDFDFPEVFEDEKEPKKSNIYTAFETNNNNIDFSKEFDDTFTPMEEPEITEDNIEPEITEEYNKPSKIVKKPFVAKYNAPPLHLMNEVSLNIDTSKENFEENRNIIEETLSNFEIPAKVVNIIHGPTVTRYDIDIPRNIQSKRVLQYADDIAMRLRSKFGVRIEQNPGEGVLAIEVPNNEKSLVGLRNVLANNMFINSKPQSLAFGIGMDVTGSVIIGDVVKMTHLLVAGSTGSGKSVCLNTLIISLITKYSPEDLRLILIDPKRVEFTIYNNLPHLVVNEIICDAAKAITALNWAIDEMERRYVLFNDLTVRDIDEYNDTIDKKQTRKLPKIVIIVDELADLMTSNKKDIEDRIMKLTQKSRAAGIHLVLATQRPSVDIITGVIKTNLPSRIAFMVASAIDSRTILDESGAEKLLGNGDMLYKMGNMKMPMRVQGAFISMKEVKAIVTFIKENNEAYFDEEISNYINSVKDEEDENSYEEEYKIEDVYIEALKTVIIAGQASISMIQRKYSVGYNKAGKIIDWMENMGYISSFEGSKSRQILISMSAFEEKYGKI